MSINVMSRLSVSTLMSLRDLMRLNCECLPLYERLAFAIYVGLVQELPTFSSLRRRILTQFGRDLKGDVERGMHKIIDVDSLVMPIHLRGRLDLPLSIWEKTMRHVVSFECTAQHDG